MSSDAAKPDKVADITADELAELRDFWAWDKGLRKDFIDYPTAWKIQDAIGRDTPPHHPECSAVTVTGMLCDCDALILHWVELGGDPHRYKLGEEQ
jgi:hypothetical protein